jgi:hypothetical protein
MYNIESYYQTRKVNASASTAEVATAAAVSTSATAASIDTIKTTEEKVELASIPLSKSKPANDNNKNKHQNHFISEDEN